MKIRGIKLDNPGQWEFLIGEIEERKIYALECKITERFMKDPTKPILLHMSSGGGDMSLALGFYDWVKQYNIQLVTIAKGEVSSAALIIYLAGIHRLAMPNSSFYVHPGNVNTHWEMGASETLGLTEAFKLLKRLMQEIITNETNGILTTPAINELESKCTLIDARLARKLGLCHRVLSPPTKPTKPQIKNRRRQKYPKLRAVS